LGCSRLRTVAADWSRYVNLFWRVPVRISAEILGILAEEFA
jgi:hypothetical protein